MVLVVLYTTESSAQHMANAATSVTSLIISQDTVEAPVTQQMQSNNVMILLIQMMLNHCSLTLSKMKHSSLLVIVTLRFKWKAH